MGSYSPGRATFPGPRQLVVCGTEGLYFAEDRSVAAAKAAYTKKLGGVIVAIYGLVDNEYTIIDGIVSIQRPCPQKTVTPEYDPVAGGWQLINYCGQHMLTAFVPTEAIALAIAKDYGAYNGGDSSNGPELQEPS